MKPPLRYQMTEFDCGTVSLLNAISFLFDREEIPAELIRAINIYTLDCYDEAGQLGGCGTSKEAINMLAHWMENYSKTKDFQIKCERYDGHEVTLDLIKSKLKKGTVIFAKSWLTEGHYVIITKIDDKYAYIFDPYYLSEKRFDESSDGKVGFYRDSKRFALDPAIEIILDHPFDYNRRVTLARLGADANKDFSLRKLDEREILVIRRTK